MFKRLTPYLLKFKELSLPEEALKSVFIEVVGMELGIKLRPSEVALENKTLLVESVRGVREEVLMHKSALMRALKERSGGASIFDIR